MAERNEWNRRKFIKTAAALGTSPLVRGANVTQKQSDSSQSNTSGVVPRRPLGRTGIEVSAMVLGGYHLGSAETDQAANEIVAKAIDHGINFFDNAGNTTTG